MVRVRVPGGVLTPDQWLTLDTLAQRLGQGSLRLTTRQSLQFHGVLKGDVRELMREVNQTLLTTLAACAGEGSTVKARLSEANSVPSRQAVSVSS